MVWEIIRIACPIIPLILHLFGIYLLWNHNADTTQNQKVLLLNLSVSELIVSSLILFENVTTILKGYKMTEVVHLLYLSFIFSHMLSMFALTIDRFAQVYLNVKYPLYWSKKKTVYLMAAIWISCVIVAFILLTYLFTESGQVVEEIDFIFNTYINTTVCILFVLTATFTYAYIMGKLLKKEALYSHQAFSESHPSAVANNVTSYSGSTLPVKTKRVLKNRATERLLLPTLLVATFIVFVVVPDFLYLLMIKGVLPWSNIAHQMTFLLFIMGLVSDALIYILLSTTVGRKFLRKVYAKKVSAHISP
ncbi:octopamine receptor beta-2R-like [Hydractinia symbiolongicarpus]|uniref:octopamine receptor beta-2R-like n=1 Tax=Hydractinia symbiolongicarpus TaxID=13093 RepID=UPI00254E6588|nr:octopamine receptor beta-2R-like [Hydractinia symbiolongicarpus]XP_057298451.1 octopamine receptor beta-2R-like [Hydractinia symbiolongicarpus]